MPKSSFLIEDILDNSPTKQEENNNSSTSSNKYKCFKKRALNQHQQQTSPNSISPASSLTSSSDEINSTTQTSSVSAAAAAAALAFDFLKQHQNPISYPTTNLFPTSDDYSSWQQLFLSQYYARVLGLAASSGAANELESASKRLRRNDDVNSTTSSSTSSIESTRSSTSSSSASHSNISPKSSGDESSSESGNNNANGGSVSPLDALLQLANSTFVNKQMMDASVNRKIAAAAASCRFSSLQSSLMEHETNSALHLGVDSLDKHQHPYHQHLQQIKTSPSSSLKPSSAFEPTSKCSIGATSIIHKPSSSIPSTNSLHHIPTTTTPSAAALAAAAAAAAASSPLKRKRKNRTAFTATQIFELERRFSTQKYLSPHDRDRIAQELSLSTAQVITWFQNRRAKQKRDMEELKNDVIAAKTLKQIDPDVDVDKIVKSEPVMMMNGHHHHSHNSSALRFKYDNDTEGEEYNEEEEDDDEIDIDNGSESDGSSLMNNSVSSSLRIASND